MDCEEVPLLVQILSHYVPSEKKVFHAKNQLEELNATSDVINGNNSE